MKNTTRATKTIARKVLKTVDAGLCSGLGKPKPGFMCIEAAVNYAFGLPHGDQPPCVHPVIRSFKIKLNDAKWSSNQARALGLRRIAIAQLGSTKIDGQAWIAWVAEQHIRRVIPIPLKIVASILPAHKTALLAAAKLCKKDGNKAAADAAADAAAYAADAAAYAAAYAAADAAAYAAYAAGKKVINTPDEILSISAQIAVEACIKFGTQGSEWLDLCD